MIRLNLVDSERCIRAGSSSQDLTRQWGVVVMIRALNVRHRLSCSPTTRPGLPGRSSAGVQEERSASVGAWRLRGAVVVVVVLLVAMAAARLASWGR